MSKLADLNNQYTGYYGSENYYKHSMAGDGFVYTDGVRAAAQEVGLYWLLDHLALYSYPTVSKKHGGKEEWLFMVSKLEHDSEGCRIVTTDGDGNRLLPDHDILLTDFPEDSQITFWTIREYGTTRAVTLLPSEY